MKKFILTLAALLLSCTFIFAQEVEDTVSFDDETVFAFEDSSETDFDDEFDDYFDDSTDVEIEEQAKAPLPMTAAKPITFSGKLVSEAGVGMFAGNTIEDYASPAAYFKFENYLNMTARASEVFGIRASVVTKFPDFELGLYECYIEYLLWDKLLFKFGKRDVKWGNTFLFDNNIMSDCKNGASASLDFPIWKINCSLIGMYQVSWNAPGKSIPSEALDDKPISGETFKETTGLPGFESVSIAGNMEIPIKNFQMNLFARRYALYNSKIQNGVTNIYLDSRAGKPTFGLETKLSLDGWDFYTQTMTDAYLGSTNKAEWFADKVSMTCGLMKDWEDPRIGFIVEYQYKYYDKAANPDSVDSHIINFKGGISRLFKCTSKMAIQFEHNFSTNEGSITPGYVYYALPHATIDVGLPIIYTPETIKVVPLVCLGFQWTY